MIDLKKAQQVFNHYVHKYNINDDKVALKISHTYRVMGIRLIFLIQDY